MNFKTFNIRVIVYIILILITSFALAWSILKDHLYVTPFTFGIFLLIESILLIRDVNRNNQKINQFFEWIRSRETVQHFRTDGGQGNLSQMLNTIIDILAEEKTARESQKMLYGSILSHLSTGVLVARRSGLSVVLCNDHMKSLLGISRVHSIDDLEKVQKGFSQLILHAEDDRPRLIKLPGDYGNESLSLRVAHFVLQEENYIIVSLQNIRFELNAEETQTWKKLIRILSHEIMNSITPVRSLSHSMQHNLHTEEGELIKPGELSDEDLQRLDEGLKVIHKRNTGLLRFVESYRKLAKIPEPVKNKVYLRDLLDNLILLFREKADQQSIRYRKVLEDDELSIQIDESQFMQLMINLIENAFIAVKDIDDPSVALRAFRSSDGRVQIEVSDNGCGIEKSEIEKIFLPFYTTRENGNGIGLSLCRQLVYMHRGNLHVVSELGQGSRFIIRL